MGKEINMDEVIMIFTNEDAQLMVEQVSFNDNVFPLTKDELAEVAKRMDWFVSNVNDYLAEVVSDIIEKRK